MRIAPTWNVASSGLYRYDFLTERDAWLGFQFELRQTGALRIGETPDLPVREIDIVFYLLGHLRDQLYSFRITHNEIAVPVVILRCEFSNGVFSLLRDIIKHGANIV